jgi:hypothetical protein
MNWQSAEAALRSYIDAGWASSPYAAVPLVYENTLDDPVELFVFVAIEGTYAEKTMFGGPGKRLSLEAGIVFIHAFVPIGTGKVTATALIQQLTDMLELRSIAPGLNTDGGNPPSPTEIGSMSDRGLPTMQPHGNYFRSSGSIPFIVIDSR